MPATPDSLRTDRLRLRRWRDADRLPFASLNADPEVMEFLPSTLSRRESDAFVNRIEACFEERGFGLWVVTENTSSHCLGYVGLWPATFESDFTPATEVGWRLARQAWGHGFAQEAAHSVVRDGFERVGLKEIVSFTSEVNLRSEEVMKSIGMTHDPQDDFDHPSVDADDPLRPHVLYRIRPE